MPSYRKTRDILVQRDGPNCFWCERFTYEASSFATNAKRHIWRTRDHIIPRSKGGSDDLENLVIACYACNAERGDRSGEEYLACLDARVEERLIDWLVIAIIETAQVNVRDEADRPVV